MTEPLDTAISRLAAWLRDYGHEKQQPFIDDVRAVLEAAKELEGLREANEILEQANSVLRKRITNAVRGLKNVGEFQHFHGEDPHQLDCSLAGRVSHVFLTGMTSAIELCRSCGEDPDFKHEPESEDE